MLQLSRNGFLNPILIPTSSRSSVAIPILDGNGNVKFTGNDPFVLFSIRQLLVGDVIAEHGVHSDVVEGERGETPLSQIFRGERRILWGTPFPK